MIITISPPDSITCVVLLTPFVCGSWMPSVISKTSTRPTWWSSLCSWSHGSWIHCTETRDIKWKEDLNSRDSCSRLVTNHTPLEIWWMMLLTCLCRWLRTDNDDDDDDEFDHHLLGEDWKWEDSGAAWWPCQEVPTSPKQFATGGVCSLCPGVWNY